MPGKPAARLTEMSVHGGKVVTGSPNVIICKKPAGRQGDGHVCPIPGHGPGRIVGCSRTVLINKRGAARMGDFIACATSPSPPVPGVNPPAGEYAPSAADDTTKGMSPDGAPDLLYKKAAEHKVTDDDNYVKALYAEAKFSDYDKDGTRDTAKVGVGLVNMSGRAQQKDGYLGASGAARVMTAEAEASSHGTALGYGANANAKAEYTTVEGSVFAGPKGDNGKNPYAEVGARGTLGIAEAGAGGFIGDDGRRVGIGGYAKAQAAAVEGEVKARTSIPIPFTDWTIDARGSGSGSVGSVGGSVQGAAYYDKQEKRVHLQGNVVVKFLAGLGIDFDLSIGKRYEQDAPPATKAADPNAGKAKDPSGGSGGQPSPGPNAVALGCFSVFIGG
jgi:uncharacterized Zn-binding protein involved in type VI secretion